MKKIISKMTTTIGVTENHKTDFVYPPSVQGDLFNHLKQEQQERVKPILRIVKRPYQVTLCIALLDCLEGNGIQPIDNPMLDMIQRIIIEACNLRPLRLIR